MQPNVSLKQQPLLPATTQTVTTGILDGSNMTGSQQPQQPVKSAGMESLDALGKTLLEQSLPPDKKLTSSSR